MEVTPFFLKKNNKKIVDAEALYVVIERIV